MSSMLGVGMHRLQIESLSVWLRVSCRQTFHVSPSIFIMHISPFLSSLTTIAGRAESNTISCGRPGNAGSVMSCFSCAPPSSYMRTVPTTCTYRMQTCVDAVRRQHSGHFQGGGSRAGGRTGPTCTVIIY